MAKATIRTKLIEQLIANGHTELPPRQKHTTPKYVTFDIVNSRGEDTCVYLYVGKAGALRKGRTVSDSIPVENMKDQLIAQWDAAHAKR